MTTTITTAQRQKALEAYTAMIKEGNPFLKIFASSRVMTKQIIYWMITTLLLYYVLPLLPEVTFNGGFAAAMVNALFIRVITHVSGGFGIYLLRDMAKLISSGQHPKWRGYLMFASLSGCVPIAVLAASIYPGYLALHGFWGYTLAVSVLLITLFGANKLANRFFPTKVADKN